MIESVIIIAAYLIGSIPTGYLLGSRAGIDIRTAGSGNVGATNVARVLGKRQGIVTLIADAGKGYLVVLVASLLQVDVGVVVLAGVAVFLGHLYPVFLGFKGGKGVATAFGVLLGLAPVASLVLVAIFVIAVASSRIVSLGSMIAAAAAPVTVWFFDYPPAVISGSVFFAAMIIVRHRANIRRLFNGTEPSFGANSQ